MVTETDFDVSSTKSKHLPQKGRTKKPAMSKYLPANNICIT